MTIFLSFLQGPADYPIPAYSFWQYYIKNGIEEAGHQWVECPGVDWALGLVPKTGAEQLKWKSESWDKTIDWLKKHPADLFLSYLYPQQVDIDAIEQIKKMGIPCINFFCDNVREFKKAPVEFGAFDLNWVPEYKASDLYKRAGFNQINLPMPMWIAPKLRILPKETNSDITFIGSKDLQRVLLFEQVTALWPDMPLSIYGSGWEEKAPLNSFPLQGNYTLSKKIAHQYQFIKANGFVAYSRKLQQRNSNLVTTYGLNSKVNGLIDFPKYNALTASSIITLGVNRFPSFRFPLLKPGTYSRLRDIEAPMLGACYLTEYTGGIEQLYEPGVEIETYKSAEDLMTTAARLLKDSKARERLRVNGQKRALTDHTVKQSINKIIQRLS